MWSEQLAGRHRLLLPLLALPEVQQRLEHVQTVVDGPQAEQGRCRGVGDQRGRLQGPKGRSPGESMTETALA